MKNIVQNYRKDKTVIEENLTPPPPTTTKLLSQIFRVGY